MWAPHQGAGLTRIAGGVIMASVGCGALASTSGLLAVWVFTVAVRPSRRGAART